MADNDPKKAVVQTDSDSVMPDWLRKAQQLAAHEESSPQIKGKVAEETAQLSDISSETGNADAAQANEEVKEIEQNEFTKNKNVSELNADGEMPEWLKKMSAPDNKVLDGKQLTAVLPATPQLEATLPSVATPQSEASPQPEAILPSVVTPQPETGSQQEATLPSVVTPQPETSSQQEATLPSVVTPEPETKLPPTQMDAMPSQVNLRLEKADVAIPGLLETKPESSTVLPVSGKEQETTSVSVKVQDKGKDDVFDSAKKFFITSLDKVQDIIEKGQTAGADTELSSNENRENAANALTGQEKKQITPVNISEKAKPVQKVQRVSEEDKKQLIEAEKVYQNGLSTIRDLIAPSSMEIRYDSLRVEGMYAQSFYVYAYPRYLDANWLSPVVNFDVTMDISQYVYPVDSTRIMKVLKKKVAQMQSSVRIMAQKGMVSDPALETALQDAEELRVQIQRGQEKLFEFGLYFTIYSDDEKKLQKIEKQLESMLGSKLIMVKRADLQMEHAFNSTLPLCLDELEISVNMNTSPLSTTFPFSSADLTSNEGILYGLNRHNDSLIIFDRFSLENANSVVFAKSGAGKSYAVKLELLRSMMVGTDVIVIDPENEYDALCQTVGGSYLRVSLTSDRRINPFDLPAPLEDDEVQPGDLLRSNIINLHGLLKIMLGGVNAEEEAILDKALIDVYAIKGITMEVIDPSGLVPPTMEDLHSVLSNMEGGQNLAQRLQKYTVGTYSGIFNKPTNVDLQSGLMVFCIRDLEDALRPTAMYIILNYIWNKVRSQLKKRILVIDEAWTMMQHDDSAKFLFGLVKRARKYYLGITTITQDVEDFIKSSYGKPVVTNSSMQLLLKQAPAAVDILAKIFNLTEGEKYMLLNSGVGQGLFFAGLKHVAIQIIASYTEDKIVTTNPEEILKERQEQFK